MNIDYKVNPGEGAFYGPKIDFIVRDCLKREWQLGTIQADFSMPERFDLFFVDQDGQRKRPAMIHRAIFGSLERFLGILIEHYAGNFPLWLAPVQIAVLTLSERQKNYANQVLQNLKNADFRAEFDSRDQTIAHKIRDAELQKIPVMIIIGDKEIQNNNVSVRRHRKGDLGSLSLDELIKQLHDEVENKIIDLP
jgi:threonyl-tRNA synthetase